MSGVLLLLSDSLRVSERNPEDVVWMERMRRNTVRSLAPIRSRISVVSGQGFGIRIGGSLTDLPAIVTVNESERLMALDIIETAQNHVQETSEWEEGDPSTAPEADRHSKRLFEIKDQLWLLTTEYIDILWVIYSRQGEVPSSRLNNVESQLDTWTGLLEEEINRQGIEPIE